MNYRQLLNELERIIRRERSVTRDMGMDQVYQQVSAAIRSMNDGYWVYVLDIYRADTGELYAVTSQDGKLYRYTVQINAGEAEVSEPQEVEIQFSDVSRMQVTVFRTAEGKVRWHGVAATATLNRVAQIDSKSLFVSLQENFESADEDDRPYLTVLHQGEQMMIGDVDIVFADKDIYFNSGTFHDSEFAQDMARAVESDPSAWGFSIAFRPTKPPELITLRTADGLEIDVPVYTEGIHIETSLLLEEQAASILTAIDVERMSEPMANPQLRKLLEKAYGDDESKIDAALDLVDEAQRSIDDNGLLTRSTPAAEEDDPQSETEVEFELSPELEAHLIDRVTSNIMRSTEGIGRSSESNQKSVERLTDEIGKLGELVKQMQESVETRLSALEKDGDERLQDELDALPSRVVAKRNIMVNRPRERGIERGIEDDPMSVSPMSEIAEQTLASLGK